MTHYLIIFCLLFSVCSFASEDTYEELFSSTPEQLGSLSMETNHLIGGVISPLSGQPVLRQTDLTVKGAESIHLSRVYIPPYIPNSFERQKWQDKADQKHLHQYLRAYKGWQFFPHTRLEYNQDTLKYRVSDPNGSTLDFYLIDSKTSLASPLTSISNASGDKTSGKYDLRNTSLHSLEKGKWLTVTAPEGIKRFYLRTDNPGSSKVYLLFKEVLLNGKILRYHYNKTRLIRIESMDPTEQHIYASLDITGAPRDGSCHFISSTGVTADYNYEIRRIHAKFKEIENGVKINREINKAAPPILTSVSSPSYRTEKIKYSDNFLVNSYSGKSEIFIPEYAGFGNDFESKVVKLSRPVGHLDAFETVYEISYTIENKMRVTHAKDKEGNVTSYHFSKNRLISAIKYYDNKNVLKKEHLFCWDDKNWLTSSEVRDGDNNLLQKKAFEFDSFGNPIKEVLTGDLSGTGIEDSYTITREFSQDGLHLLLKEEHENGKVIEYSYLPKTNLPVSKFTKENGRIILSELSYYDEFNNLIKTIHDDFVTERRVKSYTLRQQAPFFHMPEWIEETLVGKKHLIYDTHGNVAQEEVYDANGAFAYTILKEYNERGDLLSETNALGQKASYEYDDRGHCVFESNFSNRLETTKVYDTNGRLRKKSEIGSEISHDTVFEYNFQDLRIKKTDHFSHSDNYFYDFIVKKIALTVSGPDSFITKCSYDPFGRAISKTDANGNTTTYRYNTYGDITETVYPDGGSEKFGFAKDGSLLSHKEKDGQVIEYSRDVLGRVLSKKYGSNDEERFTYSGFNLLSKTDLEGNITQYTYDEIGRKIKEDYEGHITEYVYDSLGRLSQVIKQSSLAIHYKRDLAGRVIGERKMDLEGNTLYEITYTYDEDGNKASITRNINGHPSTETFTYDAFGRLILRVDPLNNAITHIYDEKHINANGQNVLQKRRTDPRGIATVETYDAFNRLVKKEVFNSLRATLSCSETIYDPHGNVTDQKDHVYFNGVFQNTQTIKRSYTSTHHIENLIKAFGSKDSTTTSFTYYPSGKLKTKTLPSGVTLSYEYNPLGYLKELTSSDGNIIHTFQYNNLGALTSARDEKQNITIERQLDAFGNTIKEKFPQFTIEKQYDDLNRLTFLKIPGQGEVFYDYDPLYLRSVTRITESGQSYTHQYEAYDLNGSVTSEKLVGDLGLIEHGSNLRGQKTSITSPYFTQECSYDSVGNLLNQSEYQYTYDDLSQLISEKDNAYAYDSLYNRTIKNQESSESNALNQVLTSGLKTYSYDLNGNRITKNEFSLIYDSLNRLIEANSNENRIVFSYDPLGRCLSKTFNKDMEHYLYHGDDEIGSLDSNLNPKNFKVLGNNDLPIAIELEGDVYAPLLDVQGNVRQLVDIASKEVKNQYEYSAFGECLHKAEAIFNPWCFASKRFDPDLQLINFSKRYYDPELAKWLSQDPEGFIDSSNLYQYVYNNPFKYKDPDGRVIMLTIPLFYWGATLALPTLSAIVTPIAYAAVTGAVMYGGYKASEALNNFVEKRHTPDQEALSGIAKESERKGVTNAEADTLIEWGKEYDFPNTRDDRGEDHWECGEHIHIGPGHIPVRN